MKILIVDDDLGVCAAVCMMVEDLFDCHVDAANTPDEAFKFLESDRYDYVISDLDLKNANFNGIGVLLAAKKNQPEVVAILMSAEDIRRDDVRKLGIDCFLGKPVSMDLLEETIDGFLP